MLLGAAQLGHRPAVGDVVGEEGRVVAEAALAPRLGRPAVPRSGASTGRLPTPPRRRGRSRRRRRRSGPRRRAAHRAAARGSRRRSPPVRRNGRSGPRGDRRAPAALMPESSAITAAPVSRVGGAGLAERVLGEGLAVLGRQLDLGRQRRAARSPGGSRRAPRACAGCGWRRRSTAPAVRPVTPADRFLLHGTELGDPRLCVARAARPAMHGRAVCAPPWPEPRRGRRRPS